jgi:hypothetical protein
VLGGATGAPFIVRWRSTLAAPCDCMAGRAGNHWLVVGVDLVSDGQVIEGDSAVGVSDCHDAGTRADGSTGP